MSEVLAQLEKKGGALDIKPVLLGKFNSTSTSVVTRTLNQSLNQFKYLWFSLYPITSDSVWICDSLNNGGYAFSDVEYFKSHSLTLHYATGSSGNASLRTMIVNYVSDTTITSQASNTGSRDLYVYGIKA